MLAAHCDSEAAAKDEAAKDNNENEDRFSARGGRKSPRTKVKEKPPITVQSLSSFFL